MFWHKKPIPEEDFTKVKDEHKQKLDKLRVAADKLSEELLKDTLNNG